MTKLTAEVIKVNNKENSKLKNNTQSIQSENDDMQPTQGTTAQEDGFRYDYDDSSDVNK
ncbi:hypothetical protein [Litchfieldia alkalitelluris]|uniref:hypothetical protein n=1 Tax=Litchfieldia alkalitelluris TaxID=304268 RepID=UPI001475E36F|nr:hypothetical protein [Litchfieldia alkalitelluris]